VKVCSRHAARSGFPHASASWRGLAPSELPPAAGALLDLRAREKVSAHRAPDSVL
jgi:hypothetical protein